jgi:peptide-methionine (S)-S-oxide reductase
MEEDKIEFVLGGGCFWCLEAIFQDVIGVTKVVSGYAGGTQKNPSYESVGQGDSGHAEVVSISFTPSVIPADTVLDLYFLSHDPTTLNRQGSDVGTQYRSIMLYKDTSQKALFEAAKSRAQVIWENPIVTEIMPLEAFYEAEAYHQNYFKNHPEKAYCQVIIAPKLHKVRQKYAQWFAVNQA